MFRIERIKSQKEVLQIREKILLELKEVTEVGGLSRIKYAKEKQEVIQLRDQLLSSQAELKSTFAPIAAINILKMNSEKYLSISGNSVMVAS